MSIDFYARLIFIPSSEVDIMILLYLATYMYIVVIC